jgi:ribosomal protein L11 methyltransferase
MDYVELTCRVAPLEPWRDILIAQLADAGFESFEETDDGFKAYIPSGEFNEAVLQEALLLPDSKETPQLAFDVFHINSKNWNQVWESNFEPVLVDDRCYIRAPFHEPRPEVEHEIVIEPKMSFGTGHHETTFLMTQWLLDTDFQGKSVLDMGCGTGILAILAAKKGARPVTAIDNYIYAFENTMENIIRNNAEEVKVLHGDSTLLGNETFDVIIANITKNVLMADMEKYAEVLNSKGSLFLSGFLEKDREDIVNQAARFGLKYKGEKQQKDWLAVLLEKNNIP